MNHLPDASASLADCLQYIADAGLIGLGIPPAEGGQGGSEADLAMALQGLRKRWAFAAEVLQSQRLSVEALRRCRNRGLSEYRLPALLDGSVFGAWPGVAMQTLAQLGSASVLATDTGRGLRLSGPIGSILHPQGCTFIVLSPVQWDAQHPPGLALLDSEQDGLHLTPQAASGSPQRRALLTLDQLFFREDELLEADASQLVIGLLLTYQALARRLGPG